MKVLREAGKHETAHVSISNDHMLNDTQRARLELFFAPFNQVLVDYLFELGNSTWTLRRPLLEAAGLTAASNWTSKTLLD